MRLQAKAGYKVTDDELQDDLRKAGKDKDSYLLNREKSYWLKFIKQGNLDTEALLKKNVRPEQLEYIESEMRRRKWLPN